VRAEVEDHLDQAVASAPAAERDDAERWAIARFGPPHLLAAQLATVALERRARWLGLAVVLAIAAVLVAMKARVAWYAATQWTLNADLRAVADAVILVDRCAFWLSAVLGVAALAWLWHGRADLAGRHHCLRGPCLLCTAAVAALGVSVTSDGVLTALQVGWDPCIAALVPLVSLALEVACASAAGILIADTVRRAACTAALLKA
jgi:hypothetical protein